MIPPGSATFLTGCIVLASIDVDAVSTYSLKAIAGGLIWLGFKLTADYIQQKRNKK